MPLHHLSCQFLTVFLPIIATPHRCGLNLYAFVQNDPVNWRDPWGLLIAFDKEQINCLGYASGFGSYVEPIGSQPSHKSKQSLEELVNELGFSCYPINSSVECNCEEGAHKMIVYITSYNINPENKDPWSDPWIFDENRENQYHAMREDSKNSWSHVPGYCAKPYGDKIKRDLKKPEDYEGAKGQAYCCCKCE